MVDDRGVLYSEKSKKILYDGQFNNGKYEGYGQLYDEETGQLLYKGEFLNGEYEGKGKRYLDNGVDYEKLNFKFGLPV